MESYNGEREAGGGLALPAASWWETAERWTSSVRLAAKESRERERENFPRAVLIGRRDRAPGVRGGGVRRSAVQVQSLRRERERRCKFCMVLHFDLFGLDSTQRMKSPQPAVSGQSIAKRFRVHATFGLSDGGNAPSYEWLTLASPHLFWGEEQ